MPGAAGWGEIFWSRYPYFYAAALFLIGVHTLLTHPNLLKKVLGLNIASTAAFLMFIAASNVRGRYEPLVDPAHPDRLFVNPLPTAVILTGIVVAISISAFALTLALKLYRHYGTLNAEELVRIRGMRSSEHD